MNLLTPNPSRMILAGLLTALLSASLSAPAGEIYRHVDADGNVTYSDEPMDDDSQPMDLAPLPEVSLPDGSNRSRQSTSTRNEEKSAGPYDRVVINRPEHDSAFWRGGGTVNIQAGSEPSLNRRHAYELEFDGERERRSRTGTFTLQNVDRGTHSIRVHIIDADGDTIESSETVRFTLHRPSRLN